MENTRRDGNNSGFVYILYVKLMHFCVICVIVTFFADSDSHKDNTSKLRHFQNPSLSLLFYEKKYD